MMAVTCTMSSRHSSFPLTRRDIDAANVTIHSRGLCTSHMIISMGLQAWSLFTCMRSTAAMAAFHWLFMAWPLPRTHSPAPNKPITGPLPRKRLASCSYTYLACIVDPVSIMHRPVAFTGSSGAIAAFHRLVMAWPLARTHSPPSTTPTIGPLHRHHRDACSYACLAVEHRHVRAVYCRDH